MLALSAKKKKNTTETLPLNQEKRLWVASVRCFLGSSFTGKWSFDTCRFLKHINELSLFFGHEVQVENCVFMARDRMDRLQ